MGCGSPAYPAGPRGGIVNDPAAWFVPAPDQVVPHLQRLVQVSVETQRIVERLRTTVSDFTAA